MALPRRPSRNALVPSCGSTTQQNPLASAASTPSSSPTNRAGSSAVRRSRRNSSISVSIGEVSVSLNRGPPCRANSAASQRPACFTRAITSGRMGGRVAVIMGPTSLGVRARTRYLPLTRHGQSRISDTADRPPRGLSGHDRQRLPRRRSGAGRCDRSPAGFVGAAARLRSQAVASGGARTAGAAAEAAPRRGIRAHRAVSGGGGRAREVHADGPVLRYRAGGPQAAHSFPSLHPGRPRPHSCLQAGASGCNRSDSAAGRSDRRRSRAAVL